MSYSSFNPSNASQRQPQSFQMALQMEREMEREMYLRQQLELQRSIQLRRALFQEQHQQFMTELESQHHMQHLQQDPLLQQQGLMELQQQLRSPGRGSFSVQEEQLLLQQQRQRLLQQQQQQQQQMQEQRRMQRDLHVSDQNMQVSSRAGPPLQRRAVQLSEDRAEPQAQGQGPVRKLSMEREPALEKTQSQQQPKNDDSKEKEPVQEDAASKKFEETKPKPSAQDEIREMSKTEQAQSEDSRKRKAPSSSTPVGTSQTEKKTRSTEKTKVPEPAAESAPKPSPTKKVSDIALLLKATEDPKVKSVSMKRSTPEPDLEDQHSAIKSDDKPAIDDKDKPGSLGRKKSLDLEALAALEALKQDSKASSNQKEKRSSHGHLDALIKTLQNTTPPPTPPPQETGREEHEPISLDTHDFSVPLLPVEPSYAGPESPVKGRKTLGTLTPRSSPEKSKDTGFPTFSELMTGSKKASAKIPGFEERDVKEPVLLPDPEEASSKPAVYTIPIDTWWPSNSVVKRERRIQGFRDEDEGREDDEEDDKSTVITESSLEALKDRLRNNVEPGVLQKLPHCKLHRVRAKQRREQCPVPLFCFQVTESHCTDMMVCCSVCSTWRHVTCGGHYTKFPVQTNTAAPFVPICDLCHEEMKFIGENSKAKKRIERQRTEHLRRTLATTSVIRQASLAKHGGTYKWPLGSVTTTHIGGHTRSVHSRHERAEKQWSETASKLGNGLGYRPKERAKVRTREFERILAYLEDAEGQTDRHNMMLFLQRDTEREHPVGFEAPRRNFFDPDEDPDSDQYYDGDDSSEAHSDGDEAESGPGKGGSGKDKIGSNTGSDVESDSMSLDSKRPTESAVTSGRSDKGKTSSHVGLLNTADGDSSSKYTSHQRLVPKEKSDVEASSIVTAESQNEVLHEADDGEVISSNDDENDASKSSICARVGCNSRPRFDSIFCSDSCGISAVERDLLNAFEYASEIHPSLLRP